MNVKNYEIDILLILLTRRYTKKEVVKKTKTKILGFRDFQKKKRTCSRIRTWEQGILFQVRFSKF